MPFLQYNFRVSKKKCLRKPYNKPFKACFFKNKSPSDLSFFGLRSALFIILTLQRCSSSFSAGTLSSRLSIEALAFTSAESMLWVCPLTIPLSIHICSTLSKDFLNTSTGKSWRVRLRVLCQGNGSSVNR